MTIGKFNYKKWIVENKYGKEPSHSNYQGSGLLNEQANTELITCYACYNSRPRIVTGKPYLFSTIHFL